MHSGVGAFELAKLTYIGLEDNLIRHLGDLVPFFFFCSSHFYFPASGQAVVTSVVPSPPRFLSSIFHRVLLTHALALSASQFAHKKKSQRIYTSMRSVGLELTKLTYTRLEDLLVRHRGDRSLCPDSRFKAACTRSKSESKEACVNRSPGASCMLLQYSVPQQDQGYLPEQPAGHSTGGGERDNYRYVTTAVQQYGYHSYFVLRATE